MGGMGHRRRVMWIAGAVALAVASCGSAPAGSDAAEDLSKEPVDPVIAVSSTAFAEGQPIPVEFTCEGDNVSPPLSWDGVPAEAVELALVFDDPDAPDGTYVHWVLFGLDPSLTDLEKGVVPTRRASGGEQRRRCRLQGPVPAPRRPPPLPVHRLRAQCRARCRRRSVWRRRPRPGTRDGDRQGNTHRHVRPVRLPGARRAIDRRRLLSRR